MESHNGSNGTPLDPPLFWLDNTFKEAGLFPFLQGQGCLFLPKKGFYFLTDNMGFLPGVAAHSFPYSI